MDRVVVAVVMFVVFVIVVVIALVVVVVVVVINGLLYCPRSSLRERVHVWPGHFTSRLHTSS